jgi:hypothetical protein
MSPPFVLAPMLVVGLLGGPEGGPEGGPTDPAKDVGPLGGPRGGADATPSCGGMLALRLSAGGAIPGAERGGTLSVPDGATSPPFGFGVNDFGGGGVEATEGEADAPAALFIHLP